MGKDILVNLAILFYFILRLSIYVSLWYLSVQHFIPVFKKVHEKDPQLFGAGAKKMMAAQSLCRSHLEIKRIQFTC